MRSPFVTIAALFGASAVALGAFGAHGLKSILLANQTAENWQTAANYHLIHSVVLLALALRPPTPRLPFFLIAFGTFIFSGTLYILAYTNLRALGAITPIGGTALILGWLSLLRAPKNHEPSSNS